MRRSVLVGLVFAGSWGCGVVKTEPKAEIKKYRLHGVVQSLDGTAKSATIKHQKIVGFMDAMTMEFPVKDAGEYAALRKSETIDATVFVQDLDYWVGEIREVK